MDTHVSGCDPFPPELTRDGSTGKAGRDGIFSTLAHPQKVKIILTRTKDGPKAECSPRRASLVALLLICCGALGRALKVKIPAILCLCLHIKEIMREGKCLPVACCISKINLRLQMKTAVGEPRTESTHRSTIIM